MNQSAAYKGERDMSRVVLCLAVLCAAVLWFPNQQRSGDCGVVKDTSGAVMPGVLVEASSPALD